MQLRWLKTYRPAYDSFLDYQNGETPSIPQVADGITSWFTLQYRDLNQGEIEWKNVPIVKENDNDR